MCQYIGLPAPPEQEDEEMRSFIAYVEERYTWDCPYCGESCESLYEDPWCESFVCEHCGKESTCDHTER